MAKVKTATATATPASTGSASTVKKPAAKKGPTLVEQTRKVIDRKLATKTVGGHYGKLPRAAICKELQDKHGMTQGQASTYYHNELRARAAADPKIAEQRAEASSLRQAAKPAPKAKPAAKAKGKKQAAA